MVAAFTINSFRMRLYRGNPVSCTDGWTVLFCKTTWNQLKKLCNIQYIISSVQQFHASFSLFNSESHDSPAAADNFLVCRGRCLSRISLKGRQGILQDQLHHSDIKFYIWLCSTTTKKPLSFVLFKSDILTGTIIIYFILGK